MVQKLNTDVLWERISLLALGIRCQLPPSSANGMGLGPRVSLFRIAKASFAKYTCLTEALLKNILSLPLLCFQLPLASTHQILQQTVIWCLFLPMKMSLPLARLLITRAPPATSLIMIRTKATYMCNAWTLQIGLCQQCGKDAHYQKARNILQLIASDKVYQSSGIRYICTIYFFSERFCIEPIGLLFDGISTYNSSDPSTRAYEAEVTFTCEHGKRIVDFTDEDREIPEEVFKCEWDGSWSPQKPVSRPISFIQNSQPITYILAQL